MDNSIKIEVHIKDKLFIVNCGDGAQKIKWLGDVAVYRHDKTYGMVTGPPKGVRLQSGAMLPLDGIISQNLENDNKVWILLNDEADLLHDKKRTQTKGTAKRLNLL